MNKEKDNLIFLDNDMIAIQIPMFSYDIELTGLIYPVLKYKHQIAGKKEESFYIYLDQWKTYSKIGVTPLDDEFENISKQLPSGNKYCIIRKESL